MTYRYERWAQTNLDVRLGLGQEEQYARCPFKDNHPHGDRNPSFGINVRRGLYFCHGCKEKGTFAKLAKELRVQLSDTAPSTEDMLSTLATMQESVEPVQVYPESWLAQFESSKAVEYWCGKRRLSEETVERFCLGFDRSKNAATIPIRDFHGRILGVIRRSLSPGAQVRYVYPKGFKITEHLWGAHECRGESMVAICEGSVDAMACWDAGIASVAVLGSRISQQQVHLLRKIAPQEVVMMPDRNKPGKAAVAQIKAATRGLPFAVGRYRRTWKGNDPADLAPWQRIEMFETAY